VARWGVELVGQSFHEECTRGIHQRLRRVLGAVRFVPQRLLVAMRNEESSIFIRWCLVLKSGLMSSTRK
jgi:hypothetical protein